MKGNLAINAKKTQKPALKAPSLRISTNLSGLKPYR